MPSTSAQPPRLTNELLEAACAGYFVDDTEQAHRSGLMSAVRSYVVSGFSRTVRSCAALPRRQRCVLRRSPKRSRRRRLGSAHHVAARPHRPPRHHPHRRPPRRRAAGRCRRASSSTSTSCTWPTTPTARRTRRSGPTTTRSSAARSRFAPSFRRAPSSRTSVVLEPLRVTEAVEVTSVAIEASVVDAKGRFIRNLAASDFQLFENDVAQTDRRRLTAARAGAVRAARGQQPEHGAAVRRRSRGRAAGSSSRSTPTTSSCVAPFSRARQHGDRSDPGSRDHPRRDRRHQALRRHGHSRRAQGSGHGPDRRSTSGAPSCCITDGYDEHSTSAFDEAVDCRCARATSRCTSSGLGGVAGISLKGEKLLTQLAEQTGGRAWFPRDKRQLVGGVRHHRRGRAAPVPADVHAHEPAARRHVADDHGQDRRPRLRVRARDGYTAPMAPPVRASFEFTADRDRAGGRPHHAGRPRGARGRRAAEGGHVPRGGAAGDDHARARLERQHDAKRRTGAGGRARVRDGDAPRGSDRA